MGNKYLYEVTLDGGRNNPNYWSWLENVQNLKAKQPDFGGIQNLCILSHTQNASTVHMLCTDGFKRNGENDVTVSEITSETLNSPDSSHQMHTDLITNYFLPHDTYPNIKI